MSKTKGDAPQYPPMESVGELIETQVDKADAAADLLTVNSQESYDEAAQILVKVKSVGKLLKDRKELITKPLNEALKSARALFAPFEARQAAAEEVIKRKMLTYRAAVEAENRKREEQLRRREEKGTMRPETIAAKREELQPVARGAKEVVRKIRKMRVVNSARVPAKYLIIDEVALRRDALAIGGLGEVIPGIEVYEEENLAI